MDINLNVVVKFDETEGLMKTLSAFVGAVQDIQAALVAAPAAVEAEEAKPKKATKKKAEPVEIALVPEPELEPADAVEPEPEPAKEVTLEEARAAATSLLKASPNNRSKVAAALEAVGAKQLSDVEPGKRAKFIELLGA